MHKKIRVLYDERRETACGMWADVGESKKRLAALYLLITQRVRKIAREHGYAVGLHGSIKRDLDLIIVPWVEKPTPSRRVLELIASEVHGAISVAERKPRGRVAYCVVIGQGLYLDISFTTFISGRGIEPLQEVLITREQWAQVKKGTVFQWPNGKTRTNVREDGTLGLVEFKKLHMNGYVGDTTYYSYTDLCRKCRIIQF